MPVHDWSKMTAGTDHAFHTAWITHLQESLNGGILPEPYYALAEQHAGHTVPDVLTLHAEDGAADHDTPRGREGVELRDAPPQVGRRLVATASSSYRAMRRTLTVRHSSGHRVVALVEMISPGNKDRPSSVEAIVSKAIWAIEHGIHVLLVDILPPGRHDPLGIHGAIWAVFDEEEYGLPKGQLLTVASYMADPLPEAHVAHLCRGDELPEMPLFLQRHAYVPVPLEAAYMAAFRGMPRLTRSSLESGSVGG